MFLHRYFPWLHILQSNYLGKPWQCLVLSCTLATRKFKAFWFPCCNWTQARWRTAPVLLGLFYLIPCCLTNPGNRSSRFCLEAGFSENGFAGYQYWKQCCHEQQNSNCWWVDASASVQYSRILCDRGSHSKTAWSFMSVSALGVALNLCMYIIPYNKVLSCLTVGCWLVIALKNTRYYLLTSSVSPIIYNFL